MGGFGGFGGLGAFGVNAQPAAAAPVPQPAPAPGGMPGFGGGEGGGGGGGGGADQPAAKAGDGAPAVPPVVKPPAEFRTDTVGGIVRKWYHELHEDVNEFQKQAQKV